MYFDKLDKLFWFRKTERSFADELKRAVISLCVLPLAWKKKKKKEQEQEQKRKTKRKKN